MDSAEGAEFAGGSASPFGRNAANQGRPWLAMNGQASTEILVLIGVFLILLVPLLLYAQGRTNAVGDDLAVQKAEFAASRLVTAADSVGYLGGGSAIVEEIEIPPNVRGVSVNRGDIIFDLDTAGGRKQIVKSSAFTIRDEGLFSIRRAGTYHVEISAIGNFSAASAEQVVMRLR